MAVVKASKFLFGHHGVIGKALGLEGRPYRTLTIRECCDEAVTVTVEFLVAIEQADELVEVIETRKFFLVENVPHPVPNED